MRRYGVPPWGRLWRSQCSGRQFMAAVVASLALVASCAGNGDSAPPLSTAIDTAPLASAPFEVGDGPSVLQGPAPVRTRLSMPLERGARGEEVRRVQLRLLELRFDPGGVDGVFGEATEMAVWAFKKLVMAAPAVGVTGKVTPEVWDRMQEPLGWVPLKHGDTATHLEVLLPQQVAVLVRDDVPALITHVSTGDGKEWCNYRRSLPDPNAQEEDSSSTTSPVKYCGKSVTPAGSYRVQFKRDGWFSGYYGDLYKPVFFNGGIAVHGYDKVPNRPASHGCVRIPNHIAEYFQSLMHRGDQVFVFDGVNDPDDLGAVPAPADVVDPRTSATTTTRAATTTSGAPGSTTTTATARPTSSAARAVTTTDSHPSAATASTRVQTSTSAAAIAPTSSP